ncbi:zinc ribbon domain-containing protein [Mesorhizobium australicum]|uniref:zinc ribbon domain-containing protein n=1 Tax=Mesorhizobium australicum TaxID=536018 RepID=UPI003336D297
MARTYPGRPPGYISWEQFQHNLKALEANGQCYQTARVSPPREGAALLQGRVICGRCGCQRARYVTRRGQVDTWYVCSRAYVSPGEPHCQSIAGWPVDKAIGELIAAEMTPAAVELALEIRKEIEARYDEADKLRLRAVERAQIDADLAQRRFMLVDPNNRLVADTLEREWNDKLRMLADLREERESALREDRATFDDAIRDRLIAMTADFKNGLVRPHLAEPRTQAAHCLSRRRRHIAQVPGRGRNPDPHPLQRRKDRNIDHPEPKILRTAGKDPARGGRIGRQASRRSCLR